MAVCIIGLYPRKLEESTEENIAITGEESDTYRMCRDVRMVKSYGSVLEMRAKDMQI